MRNTTIRASVALLVSICCLCLLSACGGSSSESAQALLNDTFSARQIESGDVNLALTVGATGSSASTKSLSVRLSGPFQTARGGQAPALRPAAAARRRRPRASAGATSTGSALYIELAGTWFSTPESAYAALQQGYAQAVKKASAAKARSTFASLGIEPARWLSHPVDVGTATIAGVETVHLTASVDVAGFLADGSKLSQAGGALGLGSTTSGASVLSPSAIAELAGSVRSAHVDLFTGKSDHLLRRLELDATVSGTSQTKAILGGLSTADIKVSLELSDLNKSQRITAPSRPESFTQLLPALQQLVGVLQAPARRAPACDRRPRRSPIGPRRSPIGPRRAPIGPRRSPSPIGARARVCGAGAVRAEPVVARASACAGPEVLR